MSISRLFANLASCWPVCTKGASRVVGSSHTLSYGMTKQCTWDLLFAHAELKNKSLFSFHITLFCIFYVVIMIWSFLYKLRMPRIAWAYTPGLHIPRSSGREQCTLSQSARVQDEHAHAGWHKTNILHTILLNTIFHNNFHEIVKF